MGTVAAVAIQKAADQPLVVDVWWWTVETAVPGIGHWVAYSFFDGLAGGILGGAIAAWALRATIQHERQMRRDDQSGAEQLRLEESLNIALDRLEERVSGAYFAVAVARASLHDPKVDQLDWTYSGEMITGKLLPPVILAEAMARSEGDTKLAGDLEKFRGGVLAALNASADIGSTALEVQINEVWGPLTTWLARPRSERLEALRSGSST